MKLKRLSIYALVIILVLGLIVGCSKDKAINSIDNNDEVKIVASTSWVGAIVEAAGVQNVDILAPVELRHPPEYDFKPSDIQLIMEADWIVMAGYEPFMNKILEANNIDEAKIIKVSTVNTKDNLIEQTRLIAEKIGTEDKQSKWEQEFTKIFSSITEEAKGKNVESTKVLVQRHMEAFVRSLGFDVLAVFSADELSPAKIGELANLNPDLIIDNYHNPQGQAIAETCGAKIVELRNFPGPEHKGLTELFIDNAKKLGI